MKRSLVVVAVVSCATPFVVAAGCSAGSTSIGSDGQPAGGSVSKAGSSGASGTGGTTGGAGGATSGGAGGATSGGAGGATSGSGGFAGSGGTGGAATGGAGASAGGGGVPAGGAGGSTAGAGGGGSGAGAAGTAGAAGAGWPDCLVKQPAITKTISEIWKQDPKAYEKVWIDAVVVTAISFGQCSATTNFTCQLFLQTKPTYSSLAEGTHEGIKLFVDAKAAPHFATLKPGDVVDVYGEAIRYVEKGNDELRLHVDLSRPGCARKVGVATPAPVTGVTLAELTIDAYAHAIGPLLVKVDTVKGKPAAKATEVFALYESELDGGVFDAGITEVENLTPYYLPGGGFQGLTAGTWTDFTSVTGVFSTFVETGSNVTYRTLGPRAHADLVK